MLKISPTRFFLGIVLQFAVSSGVHAYGDDVQGRWQTTSKAQNDSVQLNAYQFSQNGQSKLRSRSDVIQEVKQRYNAEVLKISLDKRQQVYRVRVLMPNGKVRNLQISARP